MTEREWLACSDVKRMLEFLRGRASDRKLRLFAVACCRRITYLYRVDTRALDVSERFAEGLIGSEKWSAGVGIGRGGRDAAEACANQALLELPSPPEAAAWRAAEGAARAAALGAAYAAGTEHAWKVTRAEVAIAEGVSQTQLLRCIFGNPFRPAPTLSAAVHAWDGGLVVKLAQGIYAERSSDRLPILADALEEAGCDDEDMLAHCRQGGEHARGCWPVDRILAKE